MQAPHSNEPRVIQMLTCRPTGRWLKDNSSRTCVHALERNVKQLRVAPSRDWKRLSSSSWFLLGILLCVVIRPAAAAQPAVKNVLVLHNWSNLPASWAIMESTVRARVPEQVNFYSASVENPRFDEEVYRKSLAETLGRGYGGVKLDLVIASTYPVLQFAMQYRDKMFPGVPIVFTDVSRQQAQEMWPDVTGVVSVLGMRETIDLALRLHPDTKAVAVITGVTGWDKYWLTVAQSELLRHRDKVREIDLIGPTGNQILEQVAQLPPHTVVLFQLRPDDFNQPAVDPIDVLTAVAQRVPTYSAWPGLAMNHGGVGGAYRDMPKDAVLNGGIVARVLSGERPENIPIVRDSDLRVHADWRALRRWHIAESALPAGSVIEYRQPTFWQRERKYIVIAAILIFGQALLIAGLLLQRTRKRKAEAVLRESEERFRVMADMTPSLVWMCDARGRITYLNDRRIAFTGPDSGEGYGDNWITYVHAEDVERMLGTLYEALKSKQAFSQEYRLRRSDGFYRWMFDVASPRVNGDGSFGGFIGSAIDTTDQKLAQQALEKVSGQLIEAQEKERSRIARDLHDDICQRLALLSMEIERANRSSNGSSAATKQNLDDIRKHCSEIAGDVQSLSHQLHSATLDYLGVVAAVRAFCSEVSKQHQVSIAFTERRVPKHLPKDISLCLFRVAQEALHNAVKYSGTSQFAVALFATEDEVQLVVRDGGAGFDFGEAKKNRGLGLVSMQERINLVQGRFAVDSKPGKGTRIFAAVPFVSESESSPEDAAGKKAAQGVV
ncbi:MAG: domain S-box protein [Edaphobacter sp.]|nr:domain S-box protein [Edaphobacter sp.]